MPAVGGQLIRLQGLARQYDEVFLPLYGAHQAQNAAVALAAVEAFVGAATARAATWCARRSRRSPRPAGWRSSGAARRSCSTPRTTRTAPPRLVDALEDSFTFSPLIGVVGVMADKDYEGVLAAFEPAMAAIVCTRATTPGAAGRGARGDRARDLRRSTGCTSPRGSTTRIDLAATLAEEGGIFGEALGSGGVLVTGSVVTVGEARRMLRPRDRA